MKQITYKPGVGKKHNPHTPASAYTINLKNPRRRIYVRVYGRSPLRPWIQVQTLRHTRAGDVILKFTLTMDAWVAMMSCSSEAYKKWAEIINKTKKEITHESE
jgi:hypothetical protein